MQERKRNPAAENTSKPTMKVIEGGKARSDSGIERGQKSSEKYEAIFEHVSDAIFTVSSEDGFDDANMAALEMTGYLKNEFMTLKMENLDPGSRLPSRMRPLSRTLLEHEGTYEDIAILCKDGQIRVVDLSVRKVKNQGKELAIALLRDVTEKKRMEREVITKHQELRNAYLELEKKNADLKSTQEMLVQAGKMAALGELAAGIAHELNQPLMSIRGYAQELEYMLTTIQASEAFKNESALSLKEIVTGADKMAKIISHLRTFTRKSTEDFENVDIHTPIEEALKMVSRQLQSHGIEVVRDFEKNAPKVYANALQLEQVFINMTTNARDAIDATKRGKGKISIRTRSAGKFVEVRFQDDGIGMTEKTLAKAFNPFFTTKEVGKGMGLGLSLSYGMINKIHGSIRIESEEGRGTTFVIQVPCDFRELG